MCKECVKTKIKLEEHECKDIVEVGTTSAGCTVFKVPNKEGGFDYISDSVAGGWSPVRYGCSIEELELILNDMRQEASCQDCDNCQCK